MSFGALSAAKLASFGSGWRCAAAPARSSPGHSGTEASRARQTCALACRGRATCSDYWEAYATAFPQRTHRCCGKAEGETCHVERWFGTLRARLSRLVRKTYSFSKHAENPLDAIHLFVTNYNLALQEKATAS